MNIDEIKQEIEKRTGVPASLLNGETAEENIAQAKALLAYKREAEAERPKSTREQFTEWLNAQQNAEAQDTAGAALAQIEERARIEAGGYPILKDNGGAGVDPGDSRTARQQFTEWAEKALAFDPLRNGGSW